MREAGFPQPQTIDTKEGQFWYNPKGDLCCVTLNKHQWSFRVAFLGYPSRSANLVDDVFVFAPSATDILAVLGPKYRLSFGDGVFSLCLGDEVVAKGANIAQAMGEYYLKLETLHT